MSGSPLDSDIHIRVDIRRFLPVGCALDTLIAAAIDIFRAVLMSCCIVWLSAICIGNPAAAPEPNKVTNSIGMKLTLIPSGEFLMGSPVHDTEALDDEKPQLREQITQPFFLGIHEVTHGQFARFVSGTNYRSDAERDGKGGIGTNTAGVFERKPEYGWRNPGFAQDDSHPVVNVSWNDAVAFCAWLSAKEGKKYRLPTELEWEYACKAGTTTKFYHGNAAEGLATIGNVSDGTFKTKFAQWPAITAQDGYVFTAAAGRFMPNAFGLYDMTGNVWEWCDDWYDKKKILDDPAHVYRGGSWFAEPASCRSAYRNGGAPDERLNFLGFRVAAVP